VRLAKVVCAVLVLFLLTSVADAAVRVSFIQPEKYHDEDFRSSSRRDGITAEFRKYFEKLGARYLKGNQMLSIDVLDIDLAGQYEPWRPQWSHVRIFRDTTPPRVRLRYTLSQGGKVLMSGEEAVTDMNYQWNPSARNSSDRFRYEKDMLRDWFRKRFVRLEAPRR